ncbi:hypothetical protein E2C01_074279 [Portunus trituberculatus]|uniref:Uncharacterized protein n=1 Tax=Portunus trituberculatus TaxID=210409 RepID=A0A5B7IBZ9_PORTR|nr:hypothetical protein [Portunus trituberculatus]
MRKLHGDSSARCLDIRLWEVDCCTGRRYGAIMMVSLLSNYGQEVCEESKDVHAGPHAAMSDWPSHLSPHTLPGNT